MHLGGAALVEERDELAGRRAAHDRVVDDHHTTALERGAQGVLAYPFRGKDYLEIHIDRDKAARYGVSVADVQDTIEVALGGRVITQTVEGRERFPVRIRYARDFREDEESVRRLLVSRSGMGPAPMPVASIKPALAVSPLKKFR